MTTATLPAAAAATTTGGDNTDHLYCCDPDIAMCGADLTHVPEGFEFDDLCRYCQYIDDENLPCPAEGCAA